MDSVRKGRRADYVYKVSENSAELAECKPHNGQKLFYLEGSYDRQGRLNGKRYFLAESAKDAKGQYEYLYGWDADEVRMVVDEREADQVLHNKYKMP